MTDNFLAPVAARILHYLPKGTPFIDLPLPQKSMDPAFPDDAHMLECWAKFSGKLGKNRLDKSDLFRVLANDDYNMHDAAAIKLIRERLHFDKMDPFDATLSFMTTTYGSNAEQVAMVRIRPHNLIAQQPPLIFGTGLYHPSPLYMATLAKVAQMLHCDVIVFDQPGMGGSQHQSGESVSAGDLYDALDAVIRFVVPEGGHYKVAGHSLGTIAVSKLYHAENENGRILDRVVLDARVPTRADTATRRVEISSGFMWTQLFSQIGNGGDMRPTFLHKFANAHQIEDIGWIARVAQDEYFPTNPLLFEGYILAADLNDVTDDIGVDPRIWEISGDKDLLMDGDPNYFRDKRGHIVVSGDHDHLIGLSARPDITQALVHALTLPLSEARPIASRASVYRRFSGTYNIGVFTSNHDVGGLFSATGKLGLTEVAGIGINIHAGVTLLGGHDWGTDQGEVSTSLNGGVGFDSLNLPLSLQAGYEYAMPTFVSDHMTITRSQHLTADAIVPIADLIDVGLRTYWHMDGAWDGFRIFISTKLL